MVFASASEFMCATISTSADQASVTTQVIRPSASNLGANSRPSSICSVVARGAKVVVSDTVLLGAWASCGEAGVGSRPRMRPNMDPERVPIQPNCASGCGARSARAAHQRDEPHLLGRIVAEQAGELAGDRLGAGLLDAAQRHAGVLGLQHDGDPAG